MDFEHNDLQEETANEPKTYHENGIPADQKDIFCQNHGLTLLTTSRRTDLKESPDVFGLLTAGVVLVGLAVTYFRNPLDVAVLVNYFEEMAEAADFIKPPLEVLDALAFFLSVMGVWSILLSVIRFAVEKNVWKSMSDVTGGIFSLVAVYLITNYAADVLNEEVALGYFVMSIGVIIILNSLLSFAKKQVGHPLRSTS